MLEVILILLVLLVWFSLAQISLPRLIISRGKRPAPNTATEPKKAGPFRCMVELTKTDAQGRKADSFEVKIRGLISAPVDQCDVDVQFLIADIGHERSEPRPVLSTAKQFQMEDSPAFYFRANIGKLPNNITYLSSWTQIARIRTDLLIFPRKGKRKLKFITSIISNAEDRELACSAVKIDYENGMVGYIDAKENRQRAETLTVQLAAEVCSWAPQKPTEAAVKVVSDWINAKIKASAGADNEAKKRSELEQVLKDALQCPKSHGRPHMDAVCKEMAEAATIIERYEAIELCLLVARATGNISPEQTIVLGGLADSLGVDRDKFQAKVQKILPLGIYESKDFGFILGMRPDMSADEARRQLNKEYRKWNARVTHADPDTQTQASQMLALIADARTKYIEQTCIAG
jgi:hypothetical protein